MGNETRARYNCTQTELYSICRLGWNRTKSRQAELSLIYPEYTLVYIDAKLADVKAAEDLPDFQARDLVTESAHIKLKQAAEPALQKWKLLERYIIRSFQSNQELIKPNVEAAGKDYYEAATRENPNWEDMQQMLLSGQAYIAANLAVLTSMPAGFPAEYNTAKDDFDMQYDDFMLAEAEGPDKTREKIDANNGIYDALMLMLGDVGVVMPAEMQYEATFAYLKGIVSSPGSAGLKGEVTEEGTGLKLGNVLLRLQESDREAFTDANGLYDFGNIASGKYILELLLDGYEPLLVEVKIDTGVTSTKNYTLKKIVA